LAASPTHIVGQADTSRPPGTSEQDDSELGALVDMNTDGPLAEMSKNRQGELDALTSQRFRDALKARSIQLLTYRQLIAIQGLKSMRRPEG
jgi:hypothetical protein